MKSKLFYVILLLAAFAILSVSAAETLTASQKKAALKNRINDFIATQRLGEMESIYQMMSPMYRSKVNFEQFKKSPGFKSWTVISYFIEGIQIIDDKANVHLIEYAMSSGVPAPRVDPTVLQTWILVDNIWYRDVDPKRSEYVPTNCGNVPLKRNEEPEKTDIPDLPVRKRTSGCGS